MPRTWCNRDNVANYREELCKCDVIAVLNCGQKKMAFNEKKLFFLIAVTFGMVDKLRRLLITTVNSATVWQVVVRFIYWRNIFLSVRFTSGEIVESLLVCFLLDPVKSVSDQSNYSHWIGGEKGTWWRPPALDGVGGTAIALLPPVNAAFIGGSGASMRPGNFRFMNGSMNERTEEHFRILLIDSCGFDCDVIDRRLFRRSYFTIRSRLMINSASKDQNSAPFSCFLLFQQSSNYN